MGIFIKYIIILFYLNNYDFKGSDKLYFNMTLRIPAPYCLPNYA